jgi:DNA polymerase I-like protein with 3'-5' exonuclease and polymerase domains
LENSYSLESIAQREGLPGKDEAVLREALATYGFKAPNEKRGIYALPSRLVGPYGEQDGRLPLQLLARQEREIEAQDLWGVYDLESRVLPILVEMRRRGVRVSVERLEHVEKWSREQLIEALAEVRRATGVALSPPEVTLPEALARVVRSIGLEPGRTRTGKVSITAEYLAGIQHPVGDLLRWAREVDKLRSTFCNSIRKHSITNSFTGETRIHCTFNQLRKSKDEGAGDESDTDTEGAAYGRLSCTNPNLQQQPSPDKKPKYGKLWRSIFLPDEGKLWSANDYSQQEPRVAIHYALAAGAAGMLTRAAYEAAKEAVERYRADPSTDFHDMMTRMVYGENIFAEVGKDKFKLLRRFCKEIYLGLSYGMGGAKLCRKLGLPTQVKQNKSGKLIEVAGDEGQAIIDKFNQRVPFIRQTAFVAQERARAIGYIVTLSGRRCRFPRDEQGNFDWCHKAFNRLVQGASADQTKMALIAAKEAGFASQIQVHDEIDLSVANDNEARAFATVMETCCPALMVPSRVDCEIGNSWGEAA